MKVEKIYWKNIVIMLIAVVLVFGLIKNGLTKEEKVVESNVKAVSVTVWLTDENGLDWEDGLKEVHTVLEEDYNSLELVSTHYDTNSERCNWVEFKYATEFDTIVTGRIVNHR